jgi:hypothetical protein
VDPGGGWLPPAGRCPIVQQWYHGRNWPQLTASRRMTQNTEVARNRGHDCKRRDQDSVVQETQKGLTFGKRCWKGPECNNGIRDQGLRQQLRGSKRIKNQGTRRQLRLKIEMTSVELDSKAFRLEFMK